MLSVIYEGNEKWYLRFDSRTEILLSEDEIMEIIETMPERIHKNKEQEHGQILESKGE